MSSREAVGELLKSLQTDHSAEDIEQLPDVFEGIDRTDQVSVVQLDSELNLNAIAIGLGLEEIVYEPKKFPGLVYQSSDAEGSVVLFHSGVIVAPEDQPDDPAVMMDKTVEQMSKLGLYNRTKSPISIETGSIEHLTAKHTRGQTGDSSDEINVRDSPNTMDDRTEEGSEPNMELSINVTAERFVADSQLDTEGKLEQSMETWVPPEEEVTVNGYEISDGMIYVGSELDAVEQYRGADDCLINPALEIDSSRLDPSGSRMSYWPSYADIDPGCRATYLEWLASGRRDPNTDIGYVFLFFYGIERRVLFDAQHESNVHSEIPVLLNEVEELSEVYGGKRSFSGYATRFLNAARAQYNPDALESASYTDQKQELPLGLRVKVGRQVTDGVDPESAYEWFLQAPDTSLRTPARRCEEEFKNLFLLRYEEHCDGGLTSESNEPPLKVSYSPASKCLPKQEEVEVEQIPDILALSKPTQVLQEIANDCCEELDAYSRYVGKTQDRDSVEALSLLPEPLLNQQETDSLNEFRATIENELADSKIVETTLDPLLKHLPIEQRETVRKRNLCRVTDLLEKLGFGLEPDVRSSAPSRGWGDPAVLYRLPPETAVEGATVSERIRLIQKLAVKIILANDEGSPKQTEYLIDNLGRFVERSEVNRIHLDAHRRWLVRDSPTLHGVRRRAENLPDDQKPEIATFLTALACSDGNIDTSEIQELSKMYPMLGLDEDLVHTHLHQLQTGSDRTADQPVTIQKPESTTEVYEIPGPETTEQSSNAGIELDQERVNRTLEETQEVSEFLADIFEDEEEKQKNEDDKVEPQQVESPPSSAQTKSVSLDEDHLQFLTTLSQKEHWDREEIEEVARSQGLFPDAAIDVINDHAFELLETQVIEGTDTIAVRQELVNEILE